MPVSITATETPVPSRSEPSAPSRLRTASAPRVASLEVARLNSIGVLPSRYVTPGSVPAAAICAAVPSATATPILSKVVTSRRPLASTAERAASMEVPCTITWVRAEPVSPASSSARWSCTGAWGAALALGSRAAPVRAAAAMRAHCHAGDRAPAASWSGEDGREPALRHSSSSGRGRRRRRTARDRRSSSPRTGPPARGAGHRGWTARLRGSAPSQRPTWPEVTNGTEDPRRASWRVAARRSTTATARRRSRRPRPARRATRSR